jgi:predicted Zn-dependent protease
MVAKLRSRIISLVLSICLVASWTQPATAQTGGVRLLRDAEIEHIIRIYATPIFDAAGLDPSAITVYLIDDNRLNAFVAGGMNIFINSGLLMRSKDPLEVMGVIAHETGHIAGGHLARTQEALRNASIETIIAAVLGAAAAVVGGGNAGAAVLGGGASVAQRSLLRYSRIQETSADHAGVSFLERAGYSSRGLLNFFGVLSGEEALLGGSQDPYLRTHPLSQERIDYVQNFVEHVSHYSNQPAPPELVALHGRMIGKLVGFLQPLTDVLHRYPDSDQSMEARYARAIAYYRGSQVDKGLKLVEELIAEHPDDAYFRELRGQILFENGRVGEAVESYQKAVDLDPTEPLLRLGLAQSQLETERQDLAKPALANLEEVVRREPRNGFAWHELAIAYGRTDQLGMSALALSESALARNNPVEAKEQADRAIKILPENSPAWLRAQDIKSTAKRLQEG